MPACSVGTVLHSAAHINRRPQKHWPGILRMGLHRLGHVDISHLTAYLILCLSKEPKLQYYATRTITSYQEVIAPLLYISLLNKV